MPLTNIPDTEAFRMIKEGRDLTYKNPKRSLKLSEEAYELSRSLDSNTQAFAAAQVAFAYSMSGKYDLALERVGEAITLFRKLKDRHSLGRVYGTLGAIQSTRGKPALSLRSYAKSLGLIEKNTLTHAGVLVGFGLALNNHDRREEAVDALILALEIYESFKVSPPPATYGILAVINLQIGNIQRARHYINRASAVTVKGGKDPNELNITLGNGQIELLSGNPALACRLFRRALKGGEQIHAVPVIGAALNSLSEAMRRTKRYKEAKQFATRSIVLLKKAGNDVLLQEAYSRLGQAHLATKNYSRAIEAFTLGLTGLEGMTELTHELHADLASCYAATGEHKRAYAHLAKSVAWNRERQKKQLSRFLMVEHEIATLRRDKSQQTNLRLRSDMRQAELQNSLKLIADQKRIIRSLQSIRTDANVSDPVQSELQLESHNQALIEDLHQRFPTLSQTELKLCALIRLGSPSKELATVLSMSVRTIEWHRASIRKKLGLKREEGLSLVLLGQNGESPVRGGRIETGH